MTWKLHTNTLSSKELICFRGEFQVSRDVDVSTIWHEWKLHICKALFARGNYISLWKNMHFARCRQNMWPLKSVAKSEMISHNFVGSKTPAAPSTNVTTNMNVMRKHSDNMCEFKNICHINDIESDDRKILMLLYIRTNIIAMEISSRKLYVLLCKWWHLKSRRYWYSCQTWWSCWPEWLRSWQCE